MPKHEKARGFTMIEVIAVLMIMAILIAIVVSRMASTADADLKAKAEALKSHIRYAQMRAMNMTSSVSSCNASFGIGTTSDHYYFMFRDCNTSLKVPFPAVDGDTVNLATVSATPANITITFDDWGRPCTDSNGNIPANSNITLTLSHPSAGSANITITKNTGFVP